MKKSINGSTFINDFIFCFDIDKKNKYNTIRNPVDNPAASSASPEVISIEIKAAREIYLKVFFIDISAFNKAFRTSKNSRGRNAIMNIIKGALVILNIQ